MNTGKDKTQTKYIPCTESDLRIGQVVEYYTQTSSTNWREIEILSISDAFRMAQYLKMDSNGVRIPALTHEDIVAEGWERDEEERNYYGYIHESGQWLRYNLPHTMRNFNIEIGESRDVLSGECYTIRTPLELRDLMRFLGITGVSKNKPE